MNSAIRSRLRSVLRVSLNAATTLSYPFRSREAKVPILVYHRVCPLHFSKATPYANVFPDEFERQMDYLGANFEVITVSEFLRRESSGILGGAEACVTFDDGFMDNYLYAFPILKRLGLMATFFLTTKYIGTDTVFPWMRLDPPGRADLAENRERWLPLTWEAVREMAGGGMEFGTHTHTHRDSLSNMTADDARREIEDSTRAFTEKTGRRPEVFSYPHGTFKDYNEAAIRLLRSHNYRAALTTNIGRNGRGQSLFELKRIIIYEEDSLWEFKKKVRGAYDMAGALQRLWLNAAGSKPYGPEETREGAG
jgi:peptidoglycan/xylan/chitin deacetylase (PgdA/CDA1 family)